MLRVIDEDPRNIPIMHWVYANQVRRAWEILKWVADHGFTGHKFQDFFINECEGSPLKFIAHVTSQIEKEERPMFIGRDFLE